MNWEGVPRSGCWGPRQGSQRRGVQRLRLPEGRWVGSLSAERKKVTTFLCIPAL